MLWNRQSDDTDKAAQRLQIVFLVLGYLFALSEGNGGARRDRTDDLKLAKLPLSQLSYGPNLV